MRQIFAGDVDIPSFAAFPLSSLLYPGWPILTFFFSCKLFFSSLTKLPPQCLPACPSLLELSSPCSACFYLGPFTLWVLDLRYTTSNFTFQLLSTAGGPHFPLQVTAMPSVSYRVHQFTKYQMFFLFTIKATLVYKKYFLSKENIF